MSAAERTFRLLLRAYPSEFRDAYGEEMGIVFRDQRRAGFGGARFWMEWAVDVMRSAPPLRIEAWRTRRQAYIQSTEQRAMRMTMAILAILIGVIEATNALVEGHAAAATGLDGAAITVVTLGVIAGALLLTAGIAQALRSTKAPALSPSAAFTCLAVFTFIGVVLPRLSIFAMILGIAYPIAMLIFLRWGRGQSARAIA